jgi:hypothetical protein
MDGSAICSVERTVRSVSGHLHMMVDSVDRSCRFVPGKAVCWDVFGLLWERMRVYYSTPGVRLHG